MKRLIQLAFLGVTLTLVLTQTAQISAQQAGIKVIVHPSNPESRATRSQVARLFLKKTAKWNNGTPARPVDLKSSASARARFSKEVLRKSVSSVQAYWQQQIFSGRGVPPPVKSSEAQVVAYVLKHRGGIGYVSSTTPTGRAKVLALSK